MRKTYGRKQNDPSLCVPIHCTESLALRLSIGRFKTKNLWESANWSIKTPHCPTQGVQNQCLLDGKWLVLSGFGARPSWQARAGVAIKD